MKLIAMYVCGCLLLSGCATELRTYNSNGKPTSGVPIPKPIMVKVVTTTEYEARPEAVHPKLCSSSLITESYDYVASGEYYYATVDPSQFANGSFEVNFNDKGMASKIALNSEAGSGLDSVNKLVSTVLPYLGVPKVEELEAREAVDASSRSADGEFLSASDLKAASCITTSITTELERIPAI